MTLGSRPMSSPWESWYPGLGWGIFLATVGVHRRVGTRGRCQEVWGCMWWINNVFLEQSCFVRSGPTNTGCQPWGLRGHLAKGSCQRELKTPRSHLWAVSQQTTSSLPGGRWLSVVKSAPPAPQAALLPPTAYADIGLCIDCCSASQTFDQGSPTNLASGERNF